MAQEMNFSQGYRMMYRYLDSLWEQTRDDTLGGLLGEMSLLPDGTPADPAHTEDWNDAVSLAMQRRKAGELDADLAYDAGIWFLEGWLAIGWGLSAAEVHDKELWTDLSDDYQAPVCCVVRDMIERRRIDLWEKAVKKVSDNLDDPYLHLYQ